MPQSFSRTARRFFSPETIIPFLFGSVALGVLSNAVFTALTNQFGTDTSSVLAIAIGSLLILGFAVWIVTRLIRVRDASGGVIGKRPPAKRKGLILLVSRRQPCEKAIDFHQPILERVWLLCSTKTLPIAKDLQSQYPKLILNEPRIVNDVNDPLEFHAAVENVYNALLPDGWTDQDVIADYLGMTAHGTVGVILACANSDRPMQYTPAEYSEDGMPIRPLDPMEIVLREKKLPIE